MRMSFCLLRALPGGIGRFLVMPCSVGAKHCRLRHVGSRPGIDIWPRETASEVFLNELLVLFRYPPGSAPALLGGALLLRYCAARFACNIPTLRLPAGGQVARLVTEGCEEVGMVQVAPRDAGVAWISGPGEVGKRVRLNRKTPAHLVRQGSVNIQSRPRVWKRLGARVYSGCDRTDAKRRCLHQHDGVHGPGHDRAGWSRIHGGMYRPTPPGLHGF